MHGVPILAAAAPIADSIRDLISLVTREIGHSQAAGLIADLVKWSLLGAFAGALLAVLACVVFSRLGWYDIRGRFARGLRWTIYILTVLLCAVLFGLAGFWNGAIRGSERVLKESQLATSAFPKVADAIADGMAWIQTKAATDHATDADVAQQLEDFRAGKWDLNAAKFLEQLDQFHAESADGLVTNIQQSVIEHIPQLKGGEGERLLHGFLEQFGRVLVEKKTSGQLKEYGADQIYLAIREELKAEAAKSGDPQTITRGEISKLLVRAGIVPGISKPIRIIARSQQIPLIAIAILVIIVPPICIRLFRGKPSNAMTPPPMSR